MRPGSLGIASSSARRCGGSSQTASGVTVTPARHRGAARSGRSSPMPPTLAGRIRLRAGAAARSAISSAQQLPQGTLIKVTAVYPRAVLARRRASTGQAVSYDRPRAGHLRRVARQTGRGSDLRVRRRRCCAREFMKMSEAERRAAVLEKLRLVLRRRRRSTPRSTSRRTGRPSVWSRGGPVALSALRARCWPTAGAADARWPHPLGRHRDLDLLERLHGRRVRSGAPQRGHRANS